MSDRNRDSDVINEAHRMLDVANIEPSGARLAVRIDYLIEERDKLRTRLDAAERELKTTREEERKRVEKLYEQPLAILSRIVTDLSTRGVRTGFGRVGETADETVKRMLDAEEARQGGPSADHLWQRVQELEGAVRAACEAWERVPSASLHEIRTKMRLLRKALDAALPATSERPNTGDGPLPYPYPLLDEAKRTADGFNRRIEALDSKGGDPR